MIVAGEELFEKSSSPAPLFKSFPKRYTKPETALRSSFFLLEITRTFREKLLTDTPLQKLP